MKNEELKREFEKLSDDVKWHFQRCDGFLDLKSYGRAKEELKHIPPVHRHGIFYLQLSLRIAVETSDWPTAISLAKGLCEQFPNFPQFWVHWAYAARRVEGLDAAHCILSKAKKRFPKEPLIPFNIACYECQMGRLDEAKKHLKQAFKMDKAFKNVALEDEDLRPLWPYLEKQFEE